MDNLSERYQTKGQPERDYNKEQVQSPKQTSSSQAYTQSRCINLWTRQNKLQQTLDWVNLRTFNTTGLFTGGPTNFVYNSGGVAELEEDSRFSFHIISSGVSGPDTS